MTLEKIFEVGNDWIRNNSKDKLFGIVEEKSKTRIICDTTNTSIEDFLEIGKKNNIKIILIGKSIFDENEIISEINQEDLDDSQKKKLETQIRKLKKFEKKIDFLSFSYVLDGVIYEYGKLADWYNQIENIKTKIEGIIEDDETREYRIKQENSLPKKRIKELSEELARNEDFFKRRNDYGKLDLLLSDVLEGNNIDEDSMWYRDKSEILVKAKSFFERKLLKQKEIELVNQIAKLKQEGKTKIAIRSILELTEGTLNKYYYK